MSDAKVSRIPADDAEEGSPRKRQRTAGGQSVSAGSSGTADTNGAEAVPTQNDNSWSREALDPATLTQPTTSPPPESLPDQFWMDGYRYRQPVIGWLRDEEERFKRLEGNETEGPLTLDEYRGQYTQHQMYVTRTHLERIRKEWQGSTTAYRKAVVLLEFPALLENWPIMDQFLRERSMIFEKFYCAGPICKPPIPVLKLIVFAMCGLGFTTPVDDAGSSAGLHSKEFYADEKEITDWIKERFPWFVDRDGTDRRFREWRGDSGEATLSMHIREILKRNGDMADGVFRAVRPEERGRDDAYSLHTRQHGGFWSLPFAHIDHVFEDWYSEDQFLPWRQVPDTWRILGLPHETKLKIFSFIASFGPDFIHPRAVERSEYDHLRDPIQLWVKKPPGTFRNEPYSAGMNERNSWARILQKNWLLEVAQIEQLQEIAHEALFGANRFVLGRAQWEHIMPRYSQGYDHFIGADWIKTLKLEETKYLNHLELHVDTYNKRKSRRGSLDEILVMDELQPMFKSIGSSVNLKKLMIRIEVCYITHWSDPMKVPILDVLRRFRGLNKAEVVLLPMPNSPGEASTVAFLEACMEKPKIRRGMAPSTPALVEKEKSPSAMGKWSQTKLNHFVLIYPEHPAPGPHSKSQKIQWVRSQMKLDWQDPGVPPGSW
ncbi:hypothetical protein BU23DRAFT_648739 [Bimuria novae-zelandiae CBS 107.79]|uniref:Uncharacterized protein n=1 Tax=Bimuria novae-zelandiae CBS 107.79 TaxID=1447943 RepID=A0A6A5V2J9_9PLEO|nr:hypothetical protein BU23DRAFT_648739 [Bimuria novae-zelandiae CBS 107.79]